MAQQTQIKVTGLRLAGVAAAGLLVGGGSLWKLLEGGTGVVGAVMVAAIAGVVACLLSTSLLLRE